MEHKKRAVSVCTVIVCMPYTCIYTEGEYINWTEIEMLFWCEYSLK